MSVQVTAAATPKLSLLKRVGLWFTRPRAEPKNAPDATSGPLQQASSILDALPQELDQFTRERILEIVDQVGELTDTANGPEVKAQSFVITIVAVIAPIITALFLAYETGAFFYGGEFNPHSQLSWVQFGIAHLLELVLVAIVFEMSKAKRNSNTKLWRTLFLFWLFFIVTSYVGQFMYLYGITLALHAQSIPIMGYVGIALRCASCCLIDLVCSGYLGSKPKTLEKQVDELQFRSKAIKTLTDEQVALMEALLLAARKQQEENQRQERRRLEDEQVDKFKQMILDAGLATLTSGSSKDRALY